MAFFEHEYDYFGAVLLGIMIIYQGIVYLYSCCTLRRWRQIEQDLRESDHVRSHECPHRDCETEDETD